MVLGRDVHKLDTAMYIVIASGLSKSCLSSSCNNSSDFVLKAAERAKFGKDKKSVNPISSSSTMRFVPLALSHLGLRGPHFQAVLKEFATILVTKPKGCVLLQARPFCFNPHRSPTQDPKDMGFLPNMDNAEGACQPDSERHLGLLR